jgi:hypothetical protein
MRRSKRKYRYRSRHRQLADLPSWGAVSGYAAKESRGKSLGFGKDKARAGLRSLAKLVAAALTSSEP